jgi:hypothetical protein
VPGERRFSGRSAAYLVCVGVGGEPDALTAYVRFWEGAGGQSDMDRIL